MMAEPYCSSLISAYKMTSSDGSRGSSTFGSVDLCLVAIEGWILSIHLYSSVVIVDSIEPFMARKSLIAKLLQGDCFFTGGHACQI